MSTKCYTWVQKSTMQVAMSLCVEEIWDFFNNKINMC